MRVLGVDPGTRVTGYGVVEKKREGLLHIAHGEIIQGRKVPLTASLVRIYDALREIVGTLCPDVIAIEEIFYGRNVKSLIKQGETRGVAILVGSHCGLPIHEYSPLEVKKAVVGYGRAEKIQVQKMVKAILNLPELPPEDASDALAIAICHIHFLKPVTI